MKRRWAQRALVLLLVCLVPSAAHAQTLSMSPVAVADLGSATLSGTAIDLETTLDNFSISDTRLLLTGWNVTVDATRFAEWDSSLNEGVGGYVTGGHKLPSGSLRMLKPTAVADDPLNPTPLVTDGPYFIDGASVKIASCAPAITVGTYSFTQNGPLRLRIPAAAFAGRYRSEITFSVSDGP